MAAETSPDNQALRTVKIIVFTLVGLALMVSAVCREMPLIKLANQQIILVLGSSGYRSSRAGTRRPLGALLSFIAGAGVALFLRSALGASRSNLTKASNPTKPSKPVRRAK